MSKLAVGSTTFMEINLGSIETISVRKSEIRKQISWQERVSGTEILMIHKNTNLMRMVNTKSISNKLGSIL